MKLKIAVVTLLTSFLLTGCLGSNLPKCNSDDAKSTLGEIIKNHGITLIKMKDVKEEGYGKKENIRLCSGTLISSGGKENIEYSIKWDGKNKKMFYVQIL